MNWCFATFRFSSSFWKHCLRVPFHLFPNYMRMCGPHMKKQRTAFPRNRSCHFKHTLTAYMVTPYWPQCARWCVSVCVCACLRNNVGGKQAQRNTKYHAVRLLNVSLQFTNLQCIGYDQYSVNSIQSYQSFTEF